MNPDDGTAVSLQSVSKSFGAKEVLHEVSFNVAAGEGLCILGRSGTGKSVTLKLIIVRLFRAGNQSICQNCSNTV